MISLITERCKIDFPEFEEDNFYMVPLNIIDSIVKMPDELSKWKDVIIKMCSQIKNEMNGTAYVTIDQKIIKKGETHRRGGMHTDGNYIYGWGGGGGWLTGVGGRHLSEKKHKDQYCSNTGGMLIASDVESCRAWVGDYDGSPSQGGDCSHIDVKNMRSFVLKKNQVYLANSTNIHESLPLLDDCARTLVRITLPSDYLIPR